MPVMRHPGTLVDVVGGAQVVDVPGEFEQDLVERGCCLYLFGGQPGERGDEGGKRGFVSVDVGYVGV